MGDLFIEALEAKYDAEIKSAKAVIEVYLQKPVGIGAAVSYTHLTLPTTSMV